MSEEGDDPIAEAIDGADQPVDYEKRRRTCPVSPLGVDDLHYHFISRSGMWRKIKVHQFTPTMLISLFEGRTKWLCDTFPKRDREGDVIKDAFHAQAATRWLMEECHNHGYLPTDMRELGLGVWKMPGPKGPEMVVSVGDAVWYRGRWEKPGLRLGRSIFVAKAPCDRPDFDEPAGVKVGEHLLGALKLWRYEHEIDADLVLGYIGSAALGTHPRLRTHILCSAVPGAGKSTLVELVQAALGDQAASFEDVTDAALRNSLGDQARGVLLDEAESDKDGGSRIQSIIETIRRMSTGDGARVGRADSSGGVRSVTIASAAFLAAVNPPPLHPQDRSRIHRVEMKKRSADPKVTRRVMDAVAWAATISPALRARAILQIALYQEVVPLYRAELINRGCDDRAADKFATLLAGRDILLHDGAPHPDQIDRDVEMIAPLLVEAQEAEEEDSDAASCWNFLLTSMPDEWRGGMRMSIGDMISRLRRRWIEHDGQALAANGVRLVRGPKTEEDYVLIPNSHNRLNRTFHGENRWQRGGWITSLARLGDDVERSHRGRFGGGPQRRALLIPSRYLPPPAEEDDAIPDQISRG